MTTHIEVRLDPENHIRITVRADNFINAELARNIADNAASGAANAFLGRPARRLRSLPTAMVEDQREYNFAEVKAPRTAGE
jgi:hypothetical protein